MWKVLFWQGCGLAALLGYCEKCYYATVTNFKLDFAIVPTMWYLFIDYVIDIFYRALFIYGQQYIMLS
jgi:hypothetical protein